MARIKSTQPKLIPIMWRAFYKFSVELLYANSVLGNNTSTSTVLGSIVPPIQLIKRKLKYSSIIDESVLALPRNSLFKYKNK